jgi:hypothetical protein
MADIFHLKFVMKLLFAHPNQLQSDQSFCFPRQGKFIDLFHFVEYTFRGAKQQQGSLYPFFSQSIFPVTP